MNRNFFVNDPDAFSISRLVETEEQDHGGPKPLSLQEAQVAIALAAVSGDMLIGDDLPTLFEETDRMALLQNRDLLNMARYGHAAKPLDLMTYAPEDEMPSVFLLRESKRQSILAVFNWTEKEREHRFLFSDLGSGAHNTVSNVFGNGATAGGDTSALILKVPPRSVQMVKIVDASIPASAPSVTVQAAEKIEAGKPATLSAQSAAGGVPALSYHWDFGDGTSAEGSSVTHSYTHAGNFAVLLTAEGIEGVPFEKSLTISVTGEIQTTSSGLSCISVITNADTGSWAAANSRRSHGVPGSCLSSQAREHGRKDFYRLTARECFRHGYAHSRSGV